MLTTIFGGKFKRSIYRSPNFDRIHINNRGQTRKQRKKLNLTNSLRLPKKLYNPMAALITLTSFHLLGYRPSRFLI